jgi:ectoine hydroxylase
VDSYPLRGAELEAWNELGYVLRRRAFSAAEVGRLLQDADLAIGRCKQAAEVDAEQYFIFANASGDTASICAGLDHSGTAFEALCRDPRLVDAAFQLFGERQYIHHAKLMNKKAFDGVAWLWHQDFGYWQDMGSIRPEMFSAMLFLDRATVDNGCLQVLPGSHREGHLPHRKDGDTGGGLRQTYVGDAIMSRMCQRYRPTPILAEPGDVLFFDCNLLHASGHNLSPQDRRAVIVAFNSDANRPAMHRGWPAVERGGFGGILDYQTRGEWRLQVRTSSRIS